MHGQEHGPTCTPLGMCASPGAGSWAAPHAGPCLQALSAVTAPCMKICCLRARLTRRAPSQTIEAPRPTPPARLAPLGCCISTHPTAPVVCARVGTGAEQAVGVLMHAACEHFPDAAWREGLLPLLLRVTAELQPHAAPGAAGTANAASTPCPASAHVAAARTSSAMGLTSAAVSTRHTPGLPRRHSSPVTWL